MGEILIYEEVRKHVVVVTLNRPAKCNAINGAVTRALAAAVKRAEADTDVRAVVLASSNDDVFCAGADLDELYVGNASTLSTPEGGFAGFAFHERNKPWIAAARGMAVAGGFELCLACDMIVAGVTSQFGLPEVKWGLVPAAGGVNRLPRLVPRAIALEMVATGGMIDAARAAAIGLVNRVVPDANVLDEAIALAERIAVNAPLAVQRAIAVAKTIVSMTDAEARDAAEAALQAILQTDDCREGLRAFAEKREPVWKAR